MATEGQTISASDWSEISNLTASTSYSVQNVGNTELYMIEAATKPAVADFPDGIRIPPKWSVTVERASSTKWWALAAHGSGRVSKNEAE